MVNQQHLDLLKHGVKTWNRWRHEHADIIPDLSDAKLDGAFLSDVRLSSANLSGAHLSRAHLFRAHFGRAKLSRADLSRANLWEANLYLANLSGADLTGANLSLTNLNGANLSRAHLSGANLHMAHLSGADLTGANLSGADLSGAALVGTNLREATLTHCSIYGISAWNVQLEGAKQDNLVITHRREPAVTVDNLKIAQFIYLLLNNQEIRDAIDTIGQKAVLILGRFSQERKPILDALREKLRTLNFLPIVFDFERPTQRDFTETIMTLAGLCRFIIADITNPKSSPLELQATVPNYMIPFVPILQEGEKPFSMFKDLKEK